MPGDRGSPPCLRASGAPRPVKPGPALRSGPGRGRARPPHSERRARGPMPPRGVGSRANDAPWDASFALSIPVRRLLLSTRTRAAHGWLKRRAWRRAQRPVSPTGRILGQIVVPLPRAPVHVRTHPGAGRPPGEPGASTVRARADLGQRALPTSPAGDGPPPGVVRARPLGQLHGTSVGGSLPVAEASANDPALGSPDDRGPSPAGARSTGARAVPSRRHLAQRPGPGRGHGLTTSGRPGDVAPPRARPGHGPCPGPRRSEDRARPAPAGEAAGPGTALAHAAGRRPR